MTEKILNQSNSIMICPLKLHHYKNASELMWSVYLEFEAPIYTPEGNEQFKEFIAPFSLIKNKLRGSMFLYGAFLDDRLVGVMAVRENHISLLFVLKKWQRQGIGRTLVQTYIQAFICEQTKKNKRLNYITVHSSPFGLAFYKHLGFVETGDEKIEDGIIFTPMRKQL